MIRGYARQNCHRLFVGIVVKMLVITGRQPIARFGVLETLRVRVMAKTSKAYNKWKRHIADHMKQARAFADMGLREFARVLDMSPATLSRIERGYGCDVSTVLHLHERMGTPIDNFMRPFSERQGKSNDGR